MTGFGAIEGETPVDDLSGLRDRSIRTRGQLNVSEAENIRRAVVKYLAARPSARLAPFTMEWSLRLHREMLGRVWKWAGQARTREINIGVSPEQVGPLLVQLMEDVKAWPTLGMPMVEQAARLHHRAVWIHPFLNGNGRWARLLANIWLHRNGQPMTRWPEQMIGSESVIRAEYLAAVRVADASDYATLIALHKRWAGGRA